MEFKLTPKDIAEIATAVMRGGNVKIKDKYWANSMYHDAEVCCYCGHYDVYFKNKQPHEKGCPTIKARQILDALLDAKQK